MPFDPDAFGEEIGAMIRGIVAPLTDRIKALEASLEEVRKEVAPGFSNAMIDRDGDLVVTTTRGDLLRLGRVTGGDADPVDVDSIAESVERRCEERIAEAVSRALDEWTTKHPPQKGEDGVGLAGGMIDREGDLIITTSKGETLRLGHVVGKDGADFSNVEIDYDGERTIIIRGQGGEIRKHLPIPLDRGYWRDGMTCQKGDVVTHDGSAWIALAETRERPGMATKEHWRMLARKGRDGRPPAAKIGDGDA